MSTCSRNKRDRTRYSVFSLTYYLVRKVDGSSYTYEMGAWENTPSAPRLGYYRISLSTQRKNEGTSHPIEFPYTNDSHSLYLKTFTYD